MLKKLLSLIGICTLALVYSANSNEIHIDENNNSLREGLETLEVIEAEQINTPVELETIEDVAAQDEDAEKVISEDISWEEEGDGEKLPSITKEAEIVEIEVEKYENGKVVELTETTNKTSLKLGEKLVVKLKNEEGKAWNFETDSDLMKLDNKEVKGDYLILEYNTQKAGYERLYFDLLNKDISDVQSKLLDILVE